MLTNIRRVFKEAFQNISSEKGLFFSTFITMSVIFLMLEFFGAYVVNMQKLNDYVKTNIQVKMYLKSGLNDEQRQKIQDAIYKLPETKGVKFYPKEIALQELSKSLNLTLDMKDNPLPDTVFININENADMEKIRGELSKIEGVDQVDVRSDFVKRVAGFARGLNIMTLYFSIAASIPVFILIFNFVNAGVAIRKTDIEIMTLVGASRWYIKMPFIIEGIVNVTLSSIVSLGLFYYLYSYLAEGVRMFLPVMPFASITEVFPMSAAVVFGYGMVITVVASYISVKKYIKIHGD